MTAHSSKCNICVGAHVVRIWIVQKPYTALQNIVKDHVGCLIYNPTHDIYSDYYHGMLQIGRQSVSSLFIYK